MRTIEVKINKFEELEKSVQEYVIEKWYENEDYPFLNENLIEDLLSNDDNIFKEGFTLNYSLSCCQGDGLCIKGDIDIDKVMSKVNKDLQEKFKDKIYRIYSTGNDGHYSYAHKNQIEFELDVPFDSITEIDDSDYYKLFESEILPTIQDIYMDLCRQLEKIGYDIIEYRMDIDEFTEHANANDYEYYETGRMY